MTAIKIEIIPLSVNQAWQGKRFKTPAYKRYERDMLFLLPNINIPDYPYRLEIEFGFSNKLSDIDNPVKPLQDLLQKKYGINDKDIYELSVIKKIVDKGKEYIKFELLSCERV